jgi:DNA-binding CsgD family transcriptional regulator
LYGELIQPRRREWHRRVADGLLRHSEPDPDRVSFHLQEAGDPRAASWLVQAAERAIRDYSPIAATERLRVAVAAMEAEGVRTSELGWYLLKLGSMSREFLPLDETDAYLDRALEIATATNDRLLEVNVTWARGTNRCYQGRNGLGYMRQALDSGSDLDFEARTREPMRLLQGEAIAPGVLAVWAALFGDYRQAFQAASDQFAGPSQNTFRSRFGTAFGHGGRAYAYAALGRPEEARREFHALQETFQELRHSWAQAVHYYGEYIAVAIPYYTDDRQYREWLAAQIQPRWRDHVSGASPLPQLYGLIPALLHEGRWDEVHDLTLDRVSGASTYDYFGLYALGTVVRFRGRPGLAWRQVRAGVPEGPASPPDGTLRIETQLLQELAVELALDANDLYLARSWLDAHGRWLGPAEGEHSQIARRADGLLLQARLLQRFGDIDGARALAESALDRATEPRQPLALLRAHRVLGSWRTDSRAFEAARDHLATSAHIARAAAIPHELAQTLLVQADLEAAAGQSAGAQTLLRQAAEIVDRMDLALLRPDLQRIERTVSSTGSQRVVPALLTPRELEVLRHIVEGSSNRDIAGALSLSVRTIERHISNIYNKTGIQGRAAITAYALRREII